MLLASLGLVGLWVWLWVGASPRRVVITWIVTIGIQFKIPDLFNVAVADAFLPFLALWAVYLHFGRQRALTSTTKMMLAFVGMFVAWGTLVVQLTLGEIPAWTLINKDLGVIGMIVAFAAITAICRDPGTLWSLAKAFILGAGVVNAIGLCIWTTHLLYGVTLYEEYAGVRYNGLMVDPNAWCGYIAAAAVLQVAFLIKRDALHHLWLAGCVANTVLLVLGCILSSSRSGLLTLIVGLLALVWILGINNLGRSLAITSIIAAAASCAVAFYGTEQIFGHLSSTGQIEGRMWINAEAWKEYTASPWSVLGGNGVGSFISQSRPIFGLETQIHNTFLWLLVEGGPCLLALFLIGAGIPLIRALKLGSSHNDFSGIAAGAAATLIGIMAWFMGIEGLYQRSFWILLALCDLSVIATRSYLPKVGREVRKRSYVHRRPAAC